MPQQVCLCHHFYWLLLHFTHHISSIYLRFSNFSLNRFFIILRPSLGLVLICCHALFATKAMADAEPVLNLSGYLETYHVHDFAQNDSARPNFVYSHNVANQPSINLAMLKAAFKNGRVRAHLALGSGTYMRANYALEPDDLQKIFEANFGYQLSAQHDIWLDVGVMPSHIGFESAIGADNWTVTRSILADNSPYFETGAKLSYTSTDGKWYAAALLLNGWQRIQRPAGNTTPAFGHQLTYKPNARVTLNSSSFIGNDQSDRERKMRYFHNFYGQYALTEQLSLLTGFDIGAEQKAHNSGNYSLWFTPVLMAKYRFNDQLSTAFRAEYYQDKDGVIIDSGTPNGFRTSSYSANVDYRFSNQVMLRAELRKYHGRDDYFLNDDQPSRDSLVGTTALILSF